MTGNGNWVRAIWKTRKLDLRLKNIFKYSRLVKLINDWIDLILYKYYLEIRL